jgi:alpha-L-rhamnosidase
VTAESSVFVADVRAEYHDGDVMGLGEPCPRLSWISITESAGWSQSAYEVEIDGNPGGRQTSIASVFVEWPGPPLRSRERQRIRVRVWGADGSASGWSDELLIEAGLLSPEDWTAQWITPVHPGPEGRPSYFRRLLTLRDEAGVDIERARLYATSAGINQLHVNGQVVGTSVLAPGWSAYNDRLHYETHDVTDLLSAGANVVGAVVADGWWRGYLTWEMLRDVYGDRHGLLAQLEVTYSDGSTETFGTGARWTASDGPIRRADLYNGEACDARLTMEGWDIPGFDDSGWGGTEVFSPKVGTLVSSMAPPVRRIMERAVQDVLVTPSGKTVLDFGQNLVGRVRFAVEGPAGATVTLRHAEVMEHGELGVRPLRNAKATDEYVLRGVGVETWEPAFTFHGFRYVQVEGWPSGDVDSEAFAAVVIHSDFEQTGVFSCSNDLLNRLHQNAEWGLRGNFVDVPTDCPQRDERLGWTGDLQTFAPTASFMFDVAGFLADWLEDLKAEQIDDGRVTLVVPVGPHEQFPMGKFAAAAWGDAATIVPWTMYQRFGDKGVLARQFDSMRGWVDFVRALAGERLLWPEMFQLGDWLDPDAPPDQPWRAKTDAVLVATAYFAHSARLVSQAAQVLGFVDLADEYGQLADDVRRAFRHEYVTPTGLVSSDSVTAYSLALMFDLYEKDEHRARAGARIALLSAVRGYQVSTGFVGTPLVLPALSSVGDTTTAFRLLTETACPSWLYPVTMGATTMWERWDAMLPDGSINPGEMTSFNHYSFGSVADWMQRTIGGISAEEPGYRTIRFSPVPGRSVTSADCALRTPYGHAACRWALEGREMTLEIEVPPNTSAIVNRPGLADPDIAVGSGTHHWTYLVSEEQAAEWADIPPGSPFATLGSDDVLSLS